MLFPHGVHPRLKPVEVNSKTLLVIDPEFHGTDNTFLQQMLNACLDDRTKLDNGEYIPEMYEDWQSRYPFTAPEASDNNGENTDASVLGETKKPKQKRGRKPKRKNNLSKNIGRAVFATTLPFISAK